jgi:RNA polymerase sigma-70 factor (ECF subfamily)
VDPAGRQRLQQDLSRLADGDREAFHPVFVALLPLLRGFAARGLPPSDAEDAAQEMLVKIYARAHEFDRTRDALSWVLGIAAYEIKTFRRRRERRREADSTPAEMAAREDAAATPEELAIARNLDAAILTALTELRPADAATLRAFALGERPEDVPAATFRKRVERSLARLRDLWRASHDGR